MFKHLFHLFKREFIPGFIVSFSMLRLHSLTDHYFIFKNNYQYLVRERDSQTDRDKETDRQTEDDGV